MENSKSKFIFSKISFRLFFINIEIKNSIINKGIATLFSNFSEKNRDIPTNRQKIYPILFITKFIF